MRMTSNLLFALMLSSSLLAQQPANPSPPPTETPAANSDLSNTTAAPPAETPSTNAPAGHNKAPNQKKPTRRTGAKSKQPVSELKTVPLLPGPAVVDANHVNVRGQPKLNSEVISHLAKNQKV